MHPNEFKKGYLKFSSQGGATSMSWHVNGWQFSLPVNDIQFENIKQEILHAL